MSEKRYFLHKRLGRDVIHDTLCHNWLKEEELEEHMNVQYTKYSALKKENKQLKKELERCKEWINSDKNDYELTLAFIKSKGYSLRDVLEYEKLKKWFE